MTKLLSLAALAAAIALPAAAQAQRAPAANVVTVDMQRLSAECTACKAAQNALQGQISGFQQRQQQLQQQLQTEASGLDASVKALAGKQPDAALQGRITAFQQKQQQAQQELAGREQTIQRNRAYVSQQLNQKLGPIFQSVMTARGANLMVDAGSALAAAPALDVTNDVMTQLNQQVPSVSATAPAAPPAAQGR